MEETNMTSLKFIGKLVGATLLVMGIVLLSLGAFATNVIEEADHEAIARTEASKEAKEVTKEDKPVKEAVSEEFKSAVRSAQSYSDAMNMSKSAIQGQLQGFDKFPEEAAIFAVEHIKVDWNKNALGSAESYRKALSMSKEAIEEQLLNYDNFTPEQVHYAIENLAE